VSFALGLLIGNIEGGELVDLFGYRGMTNFCAVACFMTGTVHFCLNILRDLGAPNHEPEFDIEKVSRKPGH